MATILVGSARIDENGNITGGAVGDQTKKEVSTQAMYTHSKGWYILRPKKIAHATALAEAMLRACNNENIGYDQNNRLGVIKYGTKTKTKTECDCSALVRQCIKEATGVDVGDFYTGNEADVLEKSGLFEKKIAYVSQTKTPVYDGDVLVTKSKGHTVIVVSGNPRKAAANTDAKKSITEVAEDVIAGKYGTGTARKANLKAAGYDYDKVQAKVNELLKEASSTKYYAKYTGSSSKIDVVFKAIGVPSKYIKDKDSEKYSVRKPVAAANGISGYVGSEKQNRALIDLAKRGRLKKA